MATPVYTRCKTCATATTKRCHGCSKGVDSAGLPAITYYCGRDCQRIHFKTHKKQCWGANARRQLYRGGQFLQDVYFAFREAAFNLLVYRVKSEKGMLHIYEPPVFTTGPAFFAFPDHLVSDSKDKKAILSYCNCTFASAVMGEMVQKAFRGIANHNAIHEIQFAPKDGIGRIVCHEGNEINSKDYAHEVFRVVLKDAEYILDLAGAQYAQHRAIVPLPQYLSSYYRPFPPPTVSKLGHKGGWLREIVDGDVRGIAATCDPCTFPVYYDMVKLMRLTVDDWERKQKTTLAKVLNEKQGIFEARTGEVLAALTTNIRAFAATWKVPEGPTFESVAVPLKEGSRGGRMTVKTKGYVGPEKFFEKYCADVEYGTTEQPTEQDVVAEAAG